MSALGRRARHRAGRRARRRRPAGGAPGPRRADPAIGRNLLEIAGKVGANTANIPQLEATAPVLALIVDEAVVQDGYMNALTDGFGQEAS